MTRRHADNWSHPGHYLVDPYTWPSSYTLAPNGHGHEWPTATPFVQCQSALPFCDTAISKLDHENPWSRSFVWSKVQVMFDLQNSKVKVIVKVKHIGHIWGLEFNRYICLLFRGNRTTFGWDIGNSIFDLQDLRSRLWSRSNLMVTFEPYSSIDMMLFVSWQYDHLWLRYSKFYIWPWKFKVKVMAKVKPNGHIWALEFNRYVCFSFRGNRTIFGWDIANVIFDLENLGQGLYENRPKSTQVSYRSGPTIKEIQEVVKQLSRGKESAAGGGVRTGTKT